MRDYFRFLNDDIRVEIVSRLSGSNLQSLKCVSKEWNGIISASSFVHPLLEKAETVTGVFYQGKYQWSDEDIKRISYIPIETRNTEVCTRVLDFLPESVVVLSSCNGLVCCRSCLPFLDPIYICNPFNKKWTSIKWTNPSKMTSIALSFDPSQFPEDDVLPHFKLVAISETEAETESEEYHFSFSIFLSKTGDWKKSEEICRCEHNLLKNKGIFADGSLYWLTDGNQIIMFNPELGLSCLVTMPLPATQFTAFPETCIGESKGKLHCVSLSEDGMQLWVLKDQFESLWDPTFSISLAELEQENSEFLYNVAEKLARRTTMEVVPCIDLLAFKDGVLFTRFSMDFYSYNFEFRKMKRLCGLSDLGPDSIYFPIVVPYTMSLAPVAPVEEC